MSQGRPCVLLTMQSYVDFPPQPNISMYFARSTSDSRPIFCQIAETDIKTVRNVKNMRQYYQL